MKRFQTIGFHKSTIEKKESASFSMYIDLNSSPRRTRTYNITWCDSP